MSDIKIPDNVVNAELYKEAFKQATESYDRPSAYRSMYIVRRYKELGGQYKDPKNKEEKEKMDKARKRTQLWRDEQWVQIRPYVKEDKKIKCGAGDEGKACRPLKEVKGGDDQLTMDEIITKWGKPKVLDLTDKKIADMDGRLDWKKGTFTQSGKRQRDIKDKD